MIMATEKDNTTEKQGIEVPENGQNDITTEEQTETATEPTLEERVAQLEEQVEKEKKEYLFLMAEFDNFRKRIAERNAAEGKNYLSVFYVVAKSYKIL